MIVICGLNDKFNFQVGRMLSKSLNMFFLDLESFVEYDVVNKQDIIKNISISYLNHLEKKSVKHASTFQNTVVVASYNTFALNKNHSFFKKDSIIIYLRQTKKKLDESLKIDTLNKINFNYRDYKLKKVANFTITLKNNIVTQAHNKIIEYLKEVFL